MALLFKIKIVNIKINMDFVDMLQIVIDVCVENCHYLRNVWLIHFWSANQDNMSVK